MSTTATTTTATSSTCSASAKKISICKIHPSDVKEAKLANVTEAFIIQLRRGKMGITPYQTRIEFNSIFGTCCCQSHGKSSIVARRKRRWGRCVEDENIIRGESEEHVVEEEEEEQQGGRHARNSDSDDNNGNTDGGFQLYKKHYTRDEIQEHYYDMILLSYSELQSFGRLPSRQEGTRITLHDMMIMKQQLEQEEETEDSRNSKEDTTATATASSNSTNNVKQKVIFFSHRWLQPEASEPHPDDEDLSKYNAIMDACQLYCENANSKGQIVELQDLYLWIDYCCIDQTVPDIKQRCIQTLPFYIMLSDVFIQIDHGEYMDRAWCLLE